MDLRLSALSAVFPGMRICVICVSVVFLAVLVVVVVRFQPSKSPAAVTMI
jgi:hypothetical protein